jgi:hypothetical protein
MRQQNTGEIYLKQNITSFIEPKDGLRDEYVHVTFGDFIFRGRK